MGELTAAVELYCQPIYSIRSGVDPEVQDYEVLLRKRGGQSFLAAELVELIADQERRNQLRAWNLVNLAHFSRVRPRLTIDVNLDPWQFKCPEVWDYLQALRRVGPKINLELTERNTGTLTGSAVFSQILARVQGLGFQVSLDDVGSGYNSMQVVLENARYLSRIKFSLLLFEERDLRSKLLFAQAWQSLAASRNLELVIEGVENRSLARQLVAAGCNLQQGFYWGRPFPLMDLLKPEKRQWHPRD